LNSIGFDWGQNHPFNNIFLATRKGLGYGHDARWKRSFELFKQFQNGRFQVLEKDDRLVQGWAGTQRKQLRDPRYRDYSKDRVDALNGIGFDWGQNHPLSTVSFAAGKPSNEAPNISENPFENHSGSSQKQAQFTDDQNYESSADGDGNPCIPESTVKDPTNSEDHHVAAGNNETCEHGTIAAVQLQGQESAAVDYAMAKIHLSSSNLAGSEANNRVVVLDEKCADGKENARPRKRRGPYSPWSEIFVADVLDEENQTWIANCDQMNEHNNDGSVDELQMAKAGINGCTNARHSAISESTHLQTCRPKKKLKT
jgi:hypothetical protein